MPKKGAVPSKKHNNLFVLLVILLSIAIIVLLCGTLFSVLRHKDNSGKAGKTAAAKLSNGFSCTADVQFGGNEYEVKLQKPASGNYTMTFVKPDDLKSLSFEQGTDGLKVKFGTLEAEVDPSSIPQSSLFNAVSEVFSACLKDGVNADTNSSGLNLSGASEAGTFTLSLGSDMKPKTLSIPGIKMNASFKDFQFSK